MDGSTIALIVSASATVLVAVFGFIGTVFGPLIAEQVRSKAALEREREAKEFARKEELLRRVETLGRVLRDAFIFGDENAGIRIDEERYRMLSALAKGEGFIDDYVRESIDELLQTPNGVDRIEELDVFIRVLFAWVRGDITISDLQARPF